MNKKKALETEATPTHAESGDSLLETSLDAEFARCRGGLGGANYSNQTR